VFGGILAFGFMGLFLGPTLLALAYSLLSDWVADKTPPAAPPTDTASSGQAG
jgi:predicted PurR-regulated permease PerM